MATILRAKVVPEAGGDTLFASMSAAYRGLSRAHEAAHPRAGGAARLQAVAAAVRPERPRQAAQARGRVPQPVASGGARASGERAGACSTSTASSARASRTSRPTRATRCCEFLYRQATIPEYQLRVKWQPNTLVMWDNRSVQHYASHDYYPARRTMERVTVKGDRPKGVERRLHARHGAGQRHGEARHRRGHAARPQARFRPLLNGGLATAALLACGGAAGAAPCARTGRLAQPADQDRRALSARRPDRRAGPAGRRAPAVRPSASRW